MSLVRNLPPPPYWAVIFTSKLDPPVPADYAAMADAMDDLAKTQPGYLGHESLRDAAGTGITISYWRDEASILGWKRDLDHQAAMASGRDKWYRRYHIRVAEVSRAYDFNRT